MTGKERNLEQKQLRGIINSWIQVRITRKANVLIPCFNSGLITSEHNNHPMKPAASFSRLC